MIIPNFVVFIGLVTSVMALVGAFYINNVGFFERAVALMLAYSVIVMSLSVMLSRIFSIGGYFYFLICKRDEYWESMYSLNIGISLLIAALWQYTGALSFLWFVASVGIGLVLPIVLWKTHLYKYKILPVVLILFIFIDTRFIDARFAIPCMLGLTFIGLSLLNGSFRKSYNELILLFVYSEEHGREK